MLKALGRFIKEITHRIGSNHLLLGLFNYSTWRFLEANEANRILANVMMMFAIVAFILYLLEKVFGITTPLLRISKLFKVFRNSNMLSNPQILEDRIDYTYTEGEKIYLKLKGMKWMKKFGKWLNVNKITVVGILSFGFMVVDKFMNITDKWPIPEEAVYTIIGILVLIVIKALTGRGLEKITLAEIVSGIYKDAKELGKQARAEVKAEKKKLKYEPIFEMFKQEFQTPKKEVNVEVQPQTPQQPSGSITDRR